MKATLVSAATGAALAGAPVRLVPPGSRLTEEVDAEIASNEQNNDDHTDDGKDAHAALISLRVNCEVHDGFSLGGLVRPTYWTLVLAQSCCTRHHAYDFSQSILIVSRLCLRSARIMSVSFRGGSERHSHFTLNCRDVLVLPRCYRSRPLPTRRSGRGICRRAAYQSARWSRAGRRALHSTAIGFARRDRSPADKPAASARRSPLPRNRPRALAQG